MYIWTSFSQHCDCLGCNAALLSDPCTELRCAFCSFEEDVQPKTRWQLTYVAAFSQVFASGSCCCLYVQDEYAATGSCLSRDVDEWCAAWTDNSMYNSTSGSSLSSLGKVSTLPCSVGSARSYASIRWAHTINIICRKYVLYSVIAAGDRV